MIIDKGGVVISSILTSVDPTGKSLLEIGCGNGRITSGLQGRYEKLIAIDPHVESINIASERYPEIDFRVGSGESLDFKDETFDLVLFSLSLHHQNGEKALQEVEKILAPNGIILVLEPALDSPISLLCNILEDESNDLIKAMRNVQASQYTIASTNTVLAEWLFKDRYELYDWLHNYYNQKPSPITTNQVDNFLGELIHKTPIVISDFLVLAQLTIERNS